MKTFTLLLKSLSTCMAIISLIAFTKVNAQTIVIDSTFNADGEIFPFGQNDTIYGLFISGSVQLLSDTSLVRVILSDTLGNEWMVYEAYPLIVSNSAFDLENECDETCYLDEFLPYSLKIQIIDAVLSMDSINYAMEGYGDLEELQYQAKRNKDLQKVTIMNQNISHRGWNWTAGDNELVASYYRTKSIIYGYDKFNLQGFDYYASGEFMYVSAYDFITNSGSLRDEFDWREKHDANVENTPYYSQYGWLTDLREQTSNCGSCWVFGPVASVEAVANLYFNHHYDYDLSEQDVLCCSDGGDCEGGNEYMALTYLKDHGTFDEDNYIYVYHYDENCCGQDLHDEAYILQCTGMHAVPVPTMLIDSIKTRLIRTGPLVTYIKSDNLGLNHVMSLIGYYVEDDIIQFVFKDSWPLGHFRITPLAWSDIQRMYSIMLPITVTPYKVDPPEIFKLDEDYDGYYNWGIGGMPEGWEPPCIQLSDWNDDSNRVGPCDDNFYGQPIKPEMKVCWYKPLQPVKYIENNSFFSFDDTDLNGLNNNTFIFHIENPGNAQLNLVPVNTISSNNPAHYPVNYENLDVSICMFNGYAEFSVEVKDLPDPNDPNPIGVISIKVASCDKDVLSDFNFYMIYYDCRPATELETISSDETWDGYQLKTKDYLVLHGNTLKVTGQIAMTVESDIFVEPGAEIIIDGGKLTGVCNKLWNGIDLWGDARRLQLKEYQGYASIINGGCIEYAKKGIETGRYYGYPYIPSGGIVCCDSAFFKDNQIGIRFYPYHFVWPSGAQVPNMSNIKNTQFEVTDNFYDLDYTPSLNPLEAVYIEDIWGLSIKGCDFINISDISNTVRGNGIFSMNGGYYVAKRCTDIVPHIPCANYEVCTFKNLDYGIKALSDGAEWHITIDTATFIDNYRGIFMSAINDPVITRCSFDCQDLSDRFEDSDALVGLYFEYCNRYEVEENNFSSSYGSIGQKAVGIHILNSGSYNNPNEIYNNSFNNFQTGITAAGENQKDGIGICLKCNDFTNCAFDIFVTPQGSGRVDYLGIATKQGNTPPPEDLTNPTYAAGNTFSENNGTNPNYTNEVGCNPIIYTHHGHNSSGKKIIPIPINPPPPSQQITLKADGNVQYIEKSVACPSHLEGGINIGDEKSKIIEENSFITAIEDTLNLLVDGGDTPGLNFEIQTSLPDGAIQLRQNLIDQSPYLSDTVLKSSIEKENVLLNALIKDILVANPQVAKTPSILNRLEKRFDPLPDYMMEEIMQGQYVYSSKEILEQRLAGHKMNRQFSLSKIIHFYKDDTIFFQESQDSLMDLLQNESYPSAHYELSFIYLDQNDSAGTLNTLENIPSEFYLSGDALSLHQQYESLFGILLDIISDTLEIESAQTTTLFDLSQSESMPGVYARNLLVDKHLITYTEPVYLNDFVKQTPVTVNINKNKGVNPPSMKVFPNPSGNFFIIEYHLDNSFNLSIIELSDIHGKVLKHWTLRDYQNQIIVSTEDIFTGIYLLRLFQNGNPKESLKVTVIRK